MWHGHVWGMDSLMSLPSVITKVTWSCKASAVSYNTYSKVKKFFLNTLYRALEGEIQLLFSNVPSENGKKRTGLTIFQNIFCPKFVT